MDRPGGQRSSGSRHRRHCGWRRRWLFAAHPGPPLRPRRRTPHIARTRRRCRTGGGPRPARCRAGTGSGTGRAADRPRRAGSRAPWPGGRQPRAHAVAPKEPAGGFAFPVAVRSRGLPEEVGRGRGLGLPVVEQGLQCFSRRGRGIVGKQDCPPHFGEVRPVKVVEVSRGGSPDGCGRRRALSRTSQIIGLRASSSSGSSSRATRDTVASATGRGPGARRATRPERAR